MYRMIRNFIFNIFYFFIITKNTISVIRQFKWSVFLTTSRFITQLNLLKSVSVVFNITKPVFYFRFKERYKSIFLAKSDISMPVASLQSAFLALWDSSTVIQFFLLWLYGSGEEPNLHHHIFLVYPAIKRII